MWIESVDDSAKWYTEVGMGGEQRSLFDTKKYSGVLPQTLSIEPPTADSTVLKTLPAYHTYLQSGGYSKYTPDDFTSDVRKFGLFLKDKKLSEIQTVDIQQWIGELKKVMAEKSVSLCSDRFKKDTWGVGSLMRSPAARKARLR